ncbi:MULTISPECIES: hypothetical protein [Actinosynnema]|uniref:hypothetical protein n=1 Tax=Actinosynnema TaxID=40566 RepID=UPI0020A3AF52|nr:hypothetical protein [Actinosynnema pretiosum]MCP2096257.1 hypothetical protein [Actinosynnema pretiosum]
MRAHERGHEHAEHGRGGREHRNAEPVGPQGVLALQRAAGNTAVTGLVAVQRAITVGGVAHSDVRALVEELKKVPGFDPRGAGAFLGKRLHAGASFADLAELAAAIGAAQEGGAAGRELGEAREVSAAKALDGGWVARDRVPEWAAPFTTTHKGGQDPELRMEPERGSLSIRVDVWSDTQVGVVGGADKDRSHGKFGSICATLRKLCERHGKTPVVFAAAGTGQAVITIAVAEVGAANVRVERADGVWTPLG